MDSGQSNAADPRRAHAFADSVRERGYPHSGAIEAYGAEHVAGSDPEAWLVAGHVVELWPHGVVVRPDEAEMPGQSDSAVDRPQPGRRYAVSRDPRYAWKVTAVAFDKIHLELFFEGEVADSYLDWPLDRWHRLVDMEGLT